MAKNIPQIKQQFFDENGDPLVGGKIWTYEANSTTPKATYTNRAGDTENTNPVILNSAGEAEIWCSAGLYKFIIMDSNDQTLNTINEIRVEPVDGSDEAAAASAAAAAISAAAALVSENNAETAEANAELAETNAETAETNAAASAATATTQASNASTSASNASTSASTATTQAGIATTKAGEANASAIAAAASALAADSSADAAALSETAAAASAGAATTHIANTSNPHSVTKTQVGLSNVSNDAQLKIASNLSDLANAGTARTNLGLGSMATQAASAVAITGGTITADFDGGTASNTQRITVPKNTKANLDALTRKEGTIVYATDQAKAYVDTGAALIAVGSGGGGSSLNWIEDALAPVASSEYGQRVYAFADGETQYLYAAVRVPSTYTAGGQINLRGLFYGNAAANTVLMQTVATLIRTGTDAVSSTTNQRTSTNSAITLATTANRPNAFVCDLTSSTGQINSVAVSAGDLILIRLTRDTATDTATVDAMFPPYSSEVTFT